MKKNVLAAGMLLSAVLILSACSGSGDKKQEETGTEAAAETEEESTEKSSLVKLGEYKGIKVPAMDLEVTDEDVEAEIDGVLSSMPEYYDVEGRTDVRDGDSVNIAYAGSIDGVPFDGGTDDDSNLVIGSGSFIDGFEEQLIGKELGSTSVINVTFPDPYPMNSDLAGKEAQFEVTINKIQEMVTPELTDEFVKENLGMDTVDAYRKQLKADIQEEKRQYEEQMKSRNVMQAVIDNSEFNMVQQEADDLKQNMLSIYQAYADQYGMDFDSFLSRTMGLTAEKFESECADVAVFQIKSNLIIEAVAEKEGITVDDAEYKEYAESIMAEYGADSVESLEAQYGKDDIMKSVLNTKIMNFLSEQAIEE